MQEDTNKIRFVLLAEQLLIGKNELISFINIFDKATPEKMPAIFPRMFVVTSFYGEKNTEAKLTLEIKAPDGNIASKREVIVNPGIQEYMNYFFELLGTPITQAGEYQFIVTKDGESQKIAKLYVQPK